MAPFAQVKTCGYHLFPINEQNLSIDGCSLPGVEHQTSPILVY